ncbi:MAG: rRNA biogenesis protein rrp36 [Cirrosporium novae-zelandiae]|nr:MAG: rRNA biogenesis protein rrp36 [Cirrosporium novae-zelandiae]
MALLDALNKRVRPHKEFNDEELSLSDGNESNASDNSNQTSASISSDDFSNNGNSVEENTHSNSAMDEEEEEEEEEEEKEEHGYTSSLKNISFGALAAAQQSIGKRKRSSSTHDPEKLSELRERLQAFKKNPTSTSKPPAFSQTNSSHHLHHRGSRHAPVEQSSKYPVSRRRKVIDQSATAHPQDPRFNPLCGPLNDQKLASNYSFLSTYRSSELSTLKSTLRTTRDPSERESLQLVIKRIESRALAEAAKERERKVLKEHRKKEREAVKEGKNPYYLKEKEIKKLALVERFKGMKGGQVDKVLEKRRKRRAGKERKNMPRERRGVGDAR